MRELKTPAEVDAFLDENPVAILMFGATWCAPCKVLKPKVEIIYESKKQVPLAYCDIEEHRQLVVDLEVMSVPTIMAMVDGDGAQTVVGGSVDKVQELFDVCGDMIVARGALRQ